MKKAFLFLFVLIIIYGALGAIFYGYSKLPKKETIRSTIQSDQTVDGVNLKTKIAADVDVASSCGDLTCFQEKFKTCTPASATATLTENLVYHYEIVGPKNGLCEVKSKFLKNPNSEWVGKEMTCQYDSSKDYATASQDMSNCQGELYVLMTGVYES